MQIQINSTILKKIFEKISVIKPSSVIPITEYTLVHVHEDSISFQSTDIERTLVLTTPFQGLGLEPFSFLVPTTMFYQTVKNLPEEIVTITYNNETFGVELKSKPGKYKMSGESSKDFPVFKQEKAKNSFHIKSDLFCNGIDKVAPFAASDQVRLALTGMKIDLVGNNLTLVCTDAYVMSMYTIPIESSGNCEAIVPAKTVKDLSSFMDSDSEIKVSVFDNRVVFQSENALYQVRLIDIKYPPYRTIIPETDKFANFKKNDLISSLKRLNIFSSSVKMGVLNFGDNEVILTSEDIDFNKNASERLSCTYGDVTLDQFRIGFNIIYLLDLLKKHDSEDITISFSDPTKAMVIKEIVSDEIENFSLIMPLMV